MTSECGRVAGNVDVVAVKYVCRVAYKSPAVMLHRRMKICAFSRYETEIVATTGGRFREYKTIAGIADVGATENVACELHTGHSSSASVGGAHGRNEVSEGVDRETGTACRVVHLQFHGLNDVGMTAYN